MLFTGYVYEVKAVVSLTPAEIEMLMKLSSSHYDYKCRETGLAGGFIFGLNNELNFRQKSEGGAEPVPITAEWTFRECDRTAKVCEIANYSQDKVVVALAAGVYMGMLKVCHKINEEYERLNKNSQGFQGLVEADKDE